MNRARRGLSLWVRLLLALALPLAGLGYLAVDRIGDEYAHARDARHSADRAKLQQAVTAARGPAHLQQVALEGLAKVDALGFDRSIVAAVTGLDLQSLDFAQGDELDRALARLVANYSETALITLDGRRTTLGAELDAIGQDIDRIRAQSSVQLAEPADVRRTFDRLEATLALTIGATAVDDRTADQATENSRLRALDDLILAERARGQAVLDATFDRSIDRVLAVVAAAGVLDQEVIRFWEMLNADERSAFEELVSHLEPLGEEVVGPTAISLAGQPADTAFIEASADAVIAQIDFQTMVVGYSDQFHRDVVADLEDQAERAETRARSTIIGFGAVAAISILLGSFAAWSALRPLRRLTRQAASISAGDFDLPPLPVEGPRDVRTLTAATNEMMQTLRLVDEQVVAMSNGKQLDRRLALPGEIGVSLRRSFERLETTTAQLHESEQLASAIVEQAADAIWTVDQDGAIRSANRASAELFGIDVELQIGTELTARLRTLNGEVSVRSTTGEETRVLVVSSPIDGATEPLTAVIAHDISERARYEERLAHQANHDALTGLPNRFAVLEHLASLPTDEPVAVLFIDLDGFKSVNDTQGHLAGDRVLTEIGARLVRSVRSMDFVGRLGGDEFVLITRDFRAPDDVVKFGARIIGEIEQPYRDDSTVFMLSASIGVAAFPHGLARHDLTPIDAIRYADSAVYEAKRHGRGRVELFDAELQATVVRDAEIEIALRSAIRNGELTLYLQPVFDIATREFCGAEALVRWVRPGHGLVQPREFVPIAERSSLIFEIGRWVLGQACDIAARWRREDPDSTHRIAVNIAGSHLVDGNLIADLDAALALSGADPEMLEFEITETQVIADIDRATAVLQQVRARGVSVAIDDFGTGYSSMAYLRQLPIDTLKIDSSFVAGLIAADSDSTVLDALLTIGHALGLSVVAEGIEYAEQLEYLSARGCDRAQGFLLARPSPISDAERILRAASEIMSAP